MLISSSLRQIFLIFRIPIVARNIPLNTNFPRLLPLGSYRPLPTIPTNAHFQRSTPSLDPLNPNIRAVTFQSTGAFKGEPRNCRYYISNGVVPSARAQGSGRLCRREAPLRRSTTPPGDASRHRHPFSMYFPRS